VPEKKAPAKTSTVRMDDDLRAEAKAVASKKKISLQALVEEAVRDYLKHKR
jgi:predicted HicB family RNase H-like nuclease